MLHLYNYNITNFRRVDLTRQHTRCELYKKLTYSLTKGKGVICLRDTSVLGTSRTRDKIGVKDRVTNRVSPTSYL